MTLVHDFPVKVIIGRSIYVLAFSEDQAIFLPKPTCIVLIDKLEDSLGRSVMLEPFFDVVLEVALRWTNIRKFNLAI